MPVLNDENQARLLSCMEEIRNVVGESVSERQLVETVLKHEYDFPKALDEILNDQASIQTKPTIEIEKGEGTFFFVNFTKKLKANKCFFFSFFFISIYDRNVWTTHKHN